MIATIFLYVLKSALVLSLLYIPYTLLLANERFFHFNRLMLLGILLASLVLPLCNVAPLSVDDQEVVQTAQLQMMEIGVPIENHHLQEVQPSASNTWKWVTIVYLIGMMSVLVFRLIQLSRMGSVIRGGALWKEERDGVTIYCHTNEVAPFSWMNSVVISQKDYDENGREIILHETGHILCRHSLDVILYTLVQMLQWWNPVVYMLGNSLRDVHEYQADHYTITQGVSLRGYQELIIKKAVGASSYTFANNFNHSLTKKRIAMIQPSKSHPWHRVRALYAVPLSLLALSAFATSEFKAVRRTVEEVIDSPQTLSEVASELFSADKTTANSANEQVLNEKVDSAPVNDEPEAIKDKEKQKADDQKTPAKVEYVMADQLPIYAEGNEAMREFIKKHLKRPKGVAEGTVVFVTLVIDEQGHVQSSNSDEDVSTEVSKAIDDVFRQMPPWVPGRKKGKVCNSFVQIPITL